MKHILLSLLDRQNMKNKLFKIREQYSLEIFYILAVLCITLQLLLLRQFIILDFDEDSQLITYSLRSISDALLLLLPFWLIPSKFRGYYIGITISLFTFWGLSQLWYYRTYNDLMPFSSFLLFENISPLLIRSIKASIRHTDMFFFTLPIFLFFLYRLFFLKPAKEAKLKRKQRASYIVIILFCSFSIHAANAYSYYKKEKARVFINIGGKYVNTYSNISYFELNGFVAYCIHSFVDTLLENRTLNSKEKKEIETYLSRYNLKYCDNRFAVKEKSNLIMIVVESLNSWTINFCIDSIEITPNLNRFCKEENSIVALHMQPEVQNGRSSDAHFMYNTGLLPIQNGAVAVRFGQTPYSSIPKALKGYYSLAMVCDDAKFWNQRNAFNSYGFMQLYDKHSFKSPEDINDHILLTEAANRLENIPSPFYAQLVTISMHYPYDELRIPSTEISQSQMYTAEIRNYLETVHYCDDAIGKFIQELKQKGIYENSVIAIISDHNEIDKNQVEDRREVFPEDKEIAMIVLNAPQKLQCDTLIEQIDVYPTLLDLMGVNHYDWKGLGYSIFRKKEMLVLPSKEERNKISNLMITKGYFRTR